MITIGTDTETAGAVSNPPRTLMLRATAENAPAASMLLSACLRGPRTAPPCLDAWIEKRHGLGGSGTESVSLSERCLARLISVGRPSTCQQSARPQACSAQGWAAVPAACVCQAAAQATPGLAGLCGAEWPARAPVFACMLDARRRLSFTVSHTQSSALLGKHV